MEPRLRLSRGGVFCFFCQWQAPTVGGKSQGYLTTKSSIASHIALAFSHDW